MDSGLSGFSSIESDSRTRRRFLRGVTKSELEEAAEARVRPVVEVPGLRGEGETTVDEEAVEPGTIVA